MTVDPATQLRMEPVGDSVLRVSGELDIRTCDDLEQAGRELADRGGIVVFDLSELTFCDSTGLATLVRLQKRANAAGGEVVLRAPVPRIFNLLALTGLDAFFRIES
jgi:anti-sigma B factor antagonist